MPFHIDFTGLAPISTYLCVNAAKETVGAPAPEEASTDAQTASDAQEEVPSSASAPHIDSTDVDMETDATPLAPVASSSSPSLAKRVTDATTRFISSFRGRTIQGLKFEVPEGYMGVVLRADDASNAKTRGKNVEKRKATGNAGKRRTRGSKREENNDSEPELMEGGAMDMDEEEIRTLSVASQFSSFVLWHADHPVDEGRDEYLRSLNEWTKLAHLV
ncbi:hypothetical protein C0991_000569 [Blastosporella zonata]|nr:hypothetical protein C0991_000569 [Blastosporella zonata]